MRIEEKNVIDVVSSTQKTSKNTIKNVNKQMKDKKMPKTTALFEREDLIDAGVISVKDMTKAEIKKTLKSKIAQSTIAYYHMFKQDDLIRQYEDDWSTEMRDLHVKVYKKQKKYFNEIQKEITTLIKNL